MLDLLVLLALRLELDSMNQKVRTYFGVTPREMEPSFQNLQGIASLHICLLTLH